MNLIEMTLHDVTQSRKPLNVTLRLTARGIEVAFAGYGEKTAETGEGAPVFIENRGGVPHVVVWGDVTQEEPTHILSLADAKETK